MTEQLKKKLSEGRQYRTMQPMEAKEAEEDSYVVEGYASTYNQPYDLYRDADMAVMEQVDPAAFTNCDVSDVIMQFDHTGRVFARNTNGTLELSSDDHGLKVRANLGGTETGRQLFEEIKGGYINKMSFGFTVTGETESRTEENGFVTYLRTITEIGKLYDVSAVSIPANDSTEISARSFVDGVIAKEAAERLQREERRKRIESLHKLNKEE